MSYCGRSPPALSLATISEVLPVRSAMTLAPVLASKVAAILRSAARPVSSDQVSRRRVLPWNLVSLALAWMNGMDMEAAATEATPTVLMNCLLFRSCWPITDSCLFL
ncbi:hypothetical protein D3C86_1788760 [compost metagenome]